MQTVSPDFVLNKKVLLRIDMDVTLKQVGEEWEVEEDFRLQAGLPTIKMCLEHAHQVILMGHLGRPEGKEDPKLSVAPIHKWLLQQGLETETARKFAF
jgi:phosphoglycerate kinase